jgi:hypothetical protein
MSAKWVAPLPGARHTTGNFMIETDFTKLADRLKGRRTLRRPTILPSWPGGRTERTSSDVAKHPLSEAGGGPISNNDFLLCLTDRPVSRQGGFASLLDRSIRPAWPGGAGARVMRFDALRRKPEEDIAPVAVGPPFNTRCKGI